LTFKEENRDPRKEVELAKDTKRKSVIKADMAFIAYQRVA
jgi:hypothetical protein